MKLHIDTENKTVAMEGTVGVAKVFNYLMSWFPEEWEQWKFITNWLSEDYEELMVTKEVSKNPYWSPWNETIFSNFGDDDGSPNINPCFTTSKQTTINFNQL